MQVSAQLFIEWLKHMDATERILDIWTERSKYRSTDIEDDYYDGTLVFEEGLIRLDNKAVNVFAQLSMNPSLFTPDNTRTDRLEFNNDDGLSSYIKKAQEWNLQKHLEDTEPFRTHNTLEKPTPQYKVLDFDDNILGKAFDLNEALNIFKQRYSYFKD